MAVSDHTYSLMARPASSVLGTEDSVCSISNLGNNYIIIFYFS